MRGFLYESFRLVEKNIIFHVDVSDGMWYNLREMKIKIVQNNSEENKDLF